MPHIHKKIKKGRPYYYIREIARVDGKPKVISQIYLGSIERILEMAQGTVERWLTPAPGGRFPIGSGELLANRFAR
jgi:hypothetical protein